MIQKPNFLVTDKQGKETPGEGLPLFNFLANDGDIHHFLAGYIPSHWHKELEVFLLLEGDIQIGIGDCTYRLQSGDGCFINAEVIHSFTADVSSPCRYRSFVFSPDIIGGTPGSIFDTAYVRPLIETGVSFLKFPKGDEHKFYFQQFDRAFFACAEEEYGYEFQIREALSNILLYVTSKSTEITDHSVFLRKENRLKENRLKQMITWIDNHLDQTVTVSAIADAANICTRECQRIFNQYLHYSPIAYVNRKRIFHAAKQLSDTDDSMIMIALNCGFSNPAYFSKQFKECMGSTPSEYRTAVKEGRKSCSAKQCGI